MPELSNFRSPPAEPGVYPLLLFDSVPKGTTFYINSTEPLLYKNIFTVLEELSKRSMLINFTTNGLLLKKYAKKLSKYNITNSCVSIDGPPDIHDEIRGIRGLFSFAYDGMLQLRSLRPDLHMRTSTAINHFNQNHLVDIVKILRPLNLHEMIYNHLNFIDANMANLHNKLYSHVAECTPSSIALTPPDNINLPKLAVELAHLKKYSSVVKIYPDVTTPEDLVYYYKKPLDSVCGKFCHVGTTSLAIAPNGDVQLGQRCFNYVLGNIRNSPLDAIYKNTLIKKFKFELSNAGGYFPACTRCCGGFNGALTRKKFVWSS